VQNGYNAASSHADRGASVLRFTASSIEIARQGNHVCFSILFLSRARMFSDISLTYFRVTEVDCSLNICESSNLMK
jgi:hypothetical protein